MRVASALCLLVVLAGCAGASTPTASGPAATLVIPPPPPESTVPETPECEPEVAKVMAEPHHTSDDCAQMRLNLLLTYRSCAELGKDDETMLVVRGSAKCTEDVLAEDQAKPYPSLPSAVAQKLQDAANTLKGEVGTYCTRGCPALWTAQCTAWVLEAKAEMLAAAREGALDLPPVDKLGKAIHAFDDQAAALCALPNSSWKDGAAPQSCAARVLTMLQSSANSTGECPDG